MFILALLISLVLGNTVQATPLKQDALWFAGDLRGEIKPCGCSADGDFGGLLRRASFHQKQSDQGTQLHYLDLGNNFPSPTPQGDLKQDLIQQALVYLRPKAVMVGPNELSYGIDTLDKSLPYFLTNAASEWYFPKHQRFQLGKAQVQVWGFVSPDLVYQNPNDPAQILKLTPTLLKNWKQQIQESKDTQHILLFRGGKEELEAFEKELSFSLIIVAANHDNELEQVLEFKTSQKTYAMIPTKGQGGMKVLWTPSKTLTPQVEWLGTGYPDHPELLPAFKKYDDAVRELFFQNLDRMEAAQKQTPYAGAEACQTCHAEAYRTWSHSRHAHAFKTLESVKKQYDPECIECHVVGFQKQGFLSKELTNALMNVQCENCHGPAKAHTKNPIQAKLSILNHRKLAKPVIMEATLLPLNISTIGPNKTPIVSRQAIELTDTTKDEREWFIDDSTSEI